MKFLALQDEAKACPPPALPAAMLGGALGLAAVFAAGYSVWAFRLIRESATQYAAIAAIIFCLGGAVMKLVAVRRGPVWGFPLCFAIGFIVYAVLWSIAWFALRGRHQADLIGAVAGLAALTWLWQWAFGRAQGFLVLFLVLLALHSAGYYLGGQLYAAVKGTNGRLLWGVAHGFGFGAGLGFVLWRLQSRPPASVPAAGA